MIVSDRLRDRFSADLGAIWRAGAEDRLGLAVSGGPDSTALLLLAAAAMPGRIMVATVDHQLRPESADEARHVADICGRLGIPHATLAVTVADGNVQAEARRARYAALAAWMERNGLDALATAHHADDQAETLLLRLNRASGVAGLAGARARGKVPGSAMLLLRPLLGWRRVELVDLVERACIAAVQDPTNQDERFDRARIRAALTEADWLDVHAIARSAAHLADADAALAWAAGREWAETVRIDPAGITYRCRAPRAVALRVLARIVEELDGEEPRGGAVARLLDTLADGKPGSIGNLVAKPGADGWRFLNAPPRRTLESRVEKLDPNSPAKPPG